MSITLENKKDLENKRRKEIITAAKKLFYIKSFSRTNMQAVADEAGISKGLIYHYFKSKESLLLSFSEEVEIYFRELEEMEDPLAALRRFGEDFLVNSADKYADTPPVQILLMTFANGEIDVKRYDSQNPIRRDTGREILGSLFQKAMEMKMIPSEDAATLGDIYWSFLLGKLLPMKKGNEKEKPEVYVNEILSLLCRNLT